MFYDCNSLSKVNYTGTIDQWVQIAFSGSSSNPLLYAENLYINNVLVTEVNITTATKINAYAFYNCSSLKSITIGNSVTSIGENAFRYCSSLKSVTIPDSVTSIADSVFSHCSSLKSVTIPDSVTSIGYEVFYNCGLQSVTIPDSVTSIGKDAFSGCSLQSVTIPDSVTSIGVGAFSSCSSLKSVTIGNSVTSIESYAFYECSLQSVTIPDSVTSIGVGAFSSCSSLKSVTIGNSVTSIESSAFNYCSSLEKVNYTGTIDQWVQIAFSGYCSNPISYAEKLYINDQLVTEVNIMTATKINAYAFKYCRSLKSITIGNSVTSIGEEAFYYCSSLSKVYYKGTIDQWVQIAFSGSFSNPLLYAENLYINNVLVTEANITTAIKINAYAFRGYSSFESVAIGNSVTSIGDDAFIGCSSLTSITVAENNKNYKSIDGNLYSKDGKTLIQYAIGKKDASFTIPDCVTSIGDDAFIGCSSLTSITIPDSVTSIGEFAFYNCSSLETVYYAGTAEQWSNIRIDSYNSHLTKATRYYYSATEPTAYGGNYWHYADDGVTPVIWKKED